MAEDYVKCQCPKCGSRFGVLTIQWNDYKQVTCRECGESFLLSEKIKVDPGIEAAEHATGLPGSIKEAMAQDKAGCISCPVCGGSGKVDPAVSPQLKAAWDAVNGETIRKAVKEVVTGVLEKMPSPPPALYRKYRMTQQMLFGQRRVKDFTEAASALRFISRTDVAPFVLRNTTIRQSEGAKELLIDVLFRSQAALKEGLSLFGTPLEEIEIERPSDGDGEEKARRVQASQECMEAGDGGICRRMDGTLVYGFKYPPYRPDCTCIVVPVEEKSE